MVSIFQSILNFIGQIFGLSVGLLCWVGQVLANPLGFVNATLNAILDAIVIFWPSTPASLKLSTIVNSLLSDAGWLAFFIAQIVTGIIFPLLALYLVTVIWKYLPFT